MRFDGLRSNAKKLTYLLRFCIYFFKMEKFYFCACMLTIFLYSFFGMFNIAAVFPLVSATLADSKPGGGGFLLDNFIGFLVSISPFQDFFVTIVFFAGILVLFTACLGVIAEILSGKLVQGIQKKAQIAIFKKYIYSDYQFFIDNKHGDLLFKLLTATVSTGALFWSLMKMVVEASRAVLLIALLITVSVRATVLISLLGALFFIMIFVLSRKISYVIGNAILKITSSQNVIANEALKGIKQIGIANALGAWVDRFSSKAQDYYRLKIRNITFKALPARLLEVVVFFAIAGAIILHRIFSGGNVVNILPLLSLYALAVIRIIPCFSIIGTSLIGVMGLLPNSRAIYDLLQSPTKKIEDGTKILSSFTREIVFKNVFFGYPGKELLFRGISMSFPKNKITAIVGESGSGKTSIVNLALKIYRPLRGAIVIDGLDLGDITKRSLYDKISIVTQDTFIFNDTIANNIDFGSGKSEREIVRASRRAGIHDFIMNLPGGYSAPVGDDGLKLSGGQRQRIAIARALLRDFEILILDEATASVDNISEALIQDALGDISRDKTVIIIAHRLSTIIKADNILVLEAGQIVEQGTHGQLIEGNGAYRRLYSSQVEEKSNIKEILDATT